MLIIQDRRIERITFICWFSLWEARLLSPEGILTPTKLQHLPVCLIMLPSATGDSTMLPTCALPALVRYSRHIGSVL